MSELYIYQNARRNDKKIDKLFLFMILMMEEAKQRYLVSPQYIQMYALSSKKLITDLPPSSLFVTDNVRHYNT